MQKRFITGIELNQSENDRLLSCLKMVYQFLEEEPDHSDNIVDPEDDKKILDIWADDVEFEGRIEANDLFYIS